MGEEEYGAISYGDILEFEFLILMVVRDQMLQADSFYWFSEVEGRGVCAWEWREYPSGGSGYYFLLCEGC